MPNWCLIWLSIYVTREIKYPMRHITDTYSIWIQRERFFFAFRLVLWITLHLICLMTWFNQSTCWEPQEWFTACDEYHCFHASLSTCFHESLSLCRIIAFIKAQTWTFTRKGFFFLKIKNRSQRVQKMLTATRAEGGRWGKRGREGGGEGGGSRCLNPWMKSELNTEFLWLALWK